MKTKGSDRFTEKVLGLFSKNISKRLELSNEDNRDTSAWDNLINDAPFRSTTSGNIMHSKKDKYLYYLFQGLSEIKTSSRSLYNIEIYLKRFPYGNFDVSKVDYLRYHIEMFFHEIYILQERSKSYVTRIERHLKNILNNPIQQSEFNHLKTQLTSGFNNLVTLRNQHVHSERFNNTKLDNLSILELFAIHGDLRPAKILFEIKYKERRKEWTEIISKENKHLDLVLDSFFNSLYKICFYKNGRIRLS